MGTFQSRKYYYTLITSYYTRHHFNFLFTVNTFVIMRLSTFIYTSLVVISITCSTCYAMESRSCPVLQRMKTEDYNSRAKRMDDSSSGIAAVGTVRTYKQCIEDRKQEYEEAVQAEFEERKDELENANPGFRKFCEKLIRRNHAYVILYPEEIAKMEKNNEL